MGFKAVIFDLDGTLLDTLNDLADAGNRILQEAGLPIHPVDEYRYFVGDGLVTLISRILPENFRDPEHIERFALAFRDDYARSWQVKTALYAGVGQMLTVLQDRGIGLNVLSNKPHDFTVICMQEFLDQWNFQEILGQRDGLARKPDPAGALEIAGRIGKDPADILYLGDTATDMQTATAAGMYGVGALWGFRTAAELQENGARELIKHPDELVGLV